MRLLRGLALDGGEERGKVGIVDSVFGDRLARELLRRLDLTRTTSHTMISNNEQTEPSLTSES